MKFRPEYDPKVIGRNLRRLREKKNLSVNDVSKYMYLSPAAIYKHEEGKGFPKSDTLLALMDLYEADLHDIIDDHKMPTESVKKKKTYIKEQEWGLYSKEFQIEKLVFLETLKFRQAMRVLEYASLLEKRQAG